MSAAGSAPTAGSANRARGKARIAARRRNAASVIGDLHMSGSSKLLFPRAQDALQAVYLNSSGGVTGGDAFDIEATAREGAHLALTTQAAERVYRALPGEVGRVQTRLQIEAGARLDWLPQETIVFDGAALDRRLSVEMAEDARFLLCEPLIFGRAAMGERVTDLRHADRIDIRRGGKLVWADRLRLFGDAFARLADPAIASGAQALATVVLAAPGAGARVEALREMLPETEGVFSAGVSALDPDLTVLRMLAIDGFELRRHLCPVLRRLSGAELPRPWMI
ncbi:urease accessory protein UreD [Salipiger sp. PrR002]|uniref:urease accessory protein UreD n=1 Tax=Salipiger sp. PrR002 TaxID=2706489 RepID=UPI0013BBA303|nr:urease accessory protein UreD [Salipiger sp. PrR002]NDW00667.1 urease accessory protein UreD [Salipiger sp. PrR002]NDW57738.1 urease accessory protein UreD [Salipiger sp. PrR004]